MYKFLLLSETDIQNFIQHDFEKITISKRLVYTDRNLAEQDRDRRGLHHLKLVKVSQNGAYSLIL